MIPALRGCMCPRSSGGWRRHLLPPGVSECLRCGGLRYIEPSACQVTLRGGMVGKTYLEAGQPVTVLVQWRGPGCPRNVVVRDAKGATKVRPARGLRLP